MVHLTPNQSILQAEIGSYRNFVYALLDWSTKKAALVDPHQGSLKILTELKAHRFTLECVLLTHTHWDHISGLDEILLSHPELPLFAHPKDHHRIEPKHRSQLKPIVDEQELNLGQMIIQVIWTPGHSAGGVCFYLSKIHPPALLSGDTIFIGDCGRTDLDTGCTAELFSSLQRLKKIPPQTLLYPGHHYASASRSTLGEEFQNSPPFLCNSIEELEALP